MAEPNFADKTIWTGDNLDILRGMNSECVDLIYLDPPFNSNQDYAAPVGSAAAGAAFKDTWTLPDLDVAWMGLIADEHPALAHVIKTSGMTHGKGMQSYLTMMGIVIFAAIAMMACGPSVMPTDSESNSNPSNREQSGPVLLLDEASAISILQAYLKECVLGWEKGYEDYEKSRKAWWPTKIKPEQEKQSWLMDLATGTVGGVAWTASYHGVTEVPELYVYNRGFGPSKSETWVVIGPGFDGPDNAAVVLGDGKYTRDSSRPTTWTPLLA